MKKFVIAMALFVVLLGAQVVSAATYTCTVNATGPAAIYLTDTATSPAFTNRVFALPTGAAARNQFLAIALTAIASGKNVLVNLSSTTPLTTLSGMLIQK